MNFLYLRTLWNRENYEIMKIMKILGNFTSEMRVMKVKFDSDYVK